MIATINKLKVETEENKTNRKRVAQFWLTVKSLSPTQLPGFGLLAHVYKRPFVKLNSNNLIFVGH